MEFLLKYGLENLGLNEEMETINTPGARNFDKSVIKLDENAKNANKSNNNYEYRDGVNMKEEIREIFKNIVVGNKNLWVNFLILIIVPIFMMFKSIQDKDTSFVNKIIFTAGAIAHCIITSKIVGNGYV